MNEKEGYRRLTDAFAGAMSVLLMWLIVVSAYGAFSHIDPLIIAGIALAVELVFAFTELKKRGSNLAVIVTQMFFATWIVLFVAESKKGMAFAGILPMIATAVLGAALVSLVWMIVYVLNGFRQKMSPSL